MKTIILALFFSISFYGFSQTTRVHFYNSAQVVALQKPDKSYITLNNYTLIEIEGDSLVFLNQKVLSTIKFEQGKEHFFIIKRLCEVENRLLDANFEVREVNEREFKLTLLSNKNSSEPNKKVKF